MAQIKTKAITDDAVGLAQMAVGTDGNIISYDASTNPVAIATGSNGQVLTSTGAGSPPAFEAIPASGTNTPAFHIRKSGNQTGLSSGGWTKITFDDEVYDTDSAFASDKFVAPSAGKYFFTAAAKINATDSNNGLIGSGMRFTINGAIAAQEIHFMIANPAYAEGKSVTAVLNLTATQYVEVYAYAQDDGAGNCSITGGNDRDTFFMGFKLIE